MSTSKENIPQEKKFYEFLTECFNPKTSSKDEYFIQMKLEGNKIDFTVQKVGDISELRYTSSSTYEELKQSQVLNSFNSINEIYESLLGSIKSVKASGQEQLIHIDLSKGFLNLKIPINLKDIYFELKAQEYSLEEKYKNLLDVVNDLRKRVKSLEIQNQPGMMGSGMMGPGMMGPGMMGPGMIGPGMMGPGMMSTSHGTQHSSTSENFVVEFFIFDTIIGVQGRNDLTIENLIKNFRIKLCDENIRIEKYLMLPTRVELDPHSTETLASKGITIGTTINVVTD